MAPGAALEIPRLSRGRLDPFCPAGDRKRFLLARTLLLTGIGDAQDWHDSHGDAVQFMARTIERAAERFDRRVIDPVAHVHVSLGTNPVSSGWGTGHYEKAVEEGNKAIGLDPDFSIGYSNLLSAYVDQNRLTEAETVLRKASERTINPERQRRTRLSAQW